MMNLQELKELTKKLRAFNAEDYLMDKTFAVNKFFRDNELDSAVVGLSGGIDSAVTLSLLLHASESKYAFGESPIKKVVAVIAPIEGKGTTGQEDAANKALFLVQEFHNYKLSSKKLEVIYCPLQRAAKSIMQSCKKKKSELYSRFHTMPMPSPWVEGQMDSVLRTPLFYMQAARLQEEGYKSLVVGTTNRDEGSYIGFFGKASDGMVDLQPIADLHKSEVYKVAALFPQIPASIINATPKGDVWDGKCDQEMIGAPYDFLEMYLLIKQYGLQNLVLELEDADRLIYDEYTLAIEKIHNKNIHKYQVGSPAHFIDVLERKISGGWK